MTFKTLKTQMQEAFQNLLKGNAALFITDLDKDLLWDTYLNSFTDPAEKQGHNCTCCRHFIKNYGNVVAIKDGVLITIWDFEADTEFKPTVDALRNLVKASTIKHSFVSDLKKLGTDKNIQLLEDKTTRVWEHFYFVLPNEYVNTNPLSVESIIGTKRDNRNVFKRSLDTITIDSVETVLELIAQNSLYRGEEFKGMLIEFLKLQKEYIIVANKDLYCWDKSAFMPPSIAKIRNSAIGTLLTDISEGKELDYAVTAFERMVAPTNYKRPNAVVTKAMIEEAEKTITSLGLDTSLHRRFATISDITVDKLLFVNRDSKTALGVFDTLKEELPVNPKQFAKIEEVHIDTFLKDVLPTVKSLEVLFENGHMNNLMTVVTAKDAEAPSLFKWNNPFSWSYTNAVTDSIKERVKAAGGKVDGVLRFSIQWNEDGQSICDLDAHAKEPGGDHIYYGTYKGRPTAQSGMLDVDMIRPSNVGVENIVWSDLSKMKEGTYQFIIVNYDGGRNSGFTAQVEFDGQIHDFAVNGHFAGNGVVAEVTYSKTKGFSITSKLTSTSAIVSKEKWGMTTNKFQKVSMIMNSPNHWTGDHGNKHFFFILDKAKTDETPRGFFNEFLTEDLLKNKRVFEVLGGKLKPEASDKELSGLGFSSTNRASVICKVEGKFERTLKINF